MLFHYFNRTHHGLEVKNALKLFQLKHNKQLTLTKMEIKELNKKWEWYTCVYMSYYKKLTCLKNKHKCGANKAVEWKRKLVQHHINIMFH